MSLASKPPLPDLGPPKNLIFRLTHVRNIPFMLRNGMHCRNAEVLDPNFVQIGLPDLIDRRSKRIVPCEPGGTLADYVPFYFTPCSPMMLKITTGHGGVIRRDKSELAVVVSSVGRLSDCGVRHLIADRHAVLSAAKFSEDAAVIAQLDWERLRERNFQRDANDPGRFERYEAECLAHRHVLVEAFLGLACASAEAQDSLKQAVAECGLEVPVVVRPHWYI